jgi:toxin ParE1/3/4
VKVTIGPEALVESDDAFAFYERQEPGLGWRFLETVERAAELLCEHPEAGQLVAGGLRHWVVRDFPYVILYSVRPGEIFIESVFHGSRAPRAR